MIPISKQIAYQKKRLRKGKRERSILRSLDAWQKHYTEAQSGDNIILAVEPHIYKQFVDFLSKTHKNTEL